MSLNRRLLFKLVVVTIAVYCVADPPEYKRVDIPVTVKQYGNVLSSDKWAAKFSGYTVGKTNVQNNGKMEVDLLTSHLALSFSSWLVFELSVSDGKTGNESKNLELNFTFSKFQYRQWKVEEFKGAFHVEIKKEGKKDKATLTFGESGEKIEVEK